MRSLIREGAIVLLKACVIVDTLVAAVSLYSHHLATAAMAVASGVLCVLGLRGNRR